MRKTTNVSEKNPEIPGEEQTNRSVAYVDGSYNQNNGKCGWGVVFFDGDAEPEFFSGFVYGGSWNVSGEIYAALEAVRKALNYGCSDITIFYDYTGIANWVTGAWGTKKPETRAYAEEMHRLMEFIPVHFSYVKAHTGNKWNEKADELAKSGSEIEKKSNKHRAKRKKKKKKTDAPLADGINEACRKEMERFFELDRPSFRDFANLKTFGFDKYSRAKIEGLEGQIGEAACQTIRDAIHDQKDYASAVRWAVRGLPPDVAAHKVNVDFEIRRNCQHFTL